MVLYINDHIPKYVFMAPISLLRVRRAGTFMKVGGRGQTRRRECDAAGREGGV